MAHLSSFILILLHLLISQECLTRAELSALKPTLKHFSWDSIEPARELIYHNCSTTSDEYLQCARLLLPLDWLAPEADRYNETVAVAIAKRPANIHPTDPAYGGPILINPGGPGGSGVGLVLGLGQILQMAVNDEKKFDLIGFDPRGVSYSTPNALCFSNPSDRAISYLRREAEGILDSDSHVLRLQIARAKTIGAICANREQNAAVSGDKIRAYMSTASVARDMLAIVEQEEKIYRKYYQSSAIGTSAQRPLTDEKPATTALPMLQYWGFSYGTYLGATFASMYPDRVKRMVLDGVVHTDNYASTAWSILQDTEKAMQSFYQTCHEAGPRCPLYDGAGPRAMQVRVDALLSRLQDHPIAASVPSEDLSLVQPGVITYSDVKYLIFLALYAPLVSFPDLASILAGLENGNYSKILGLIRNQRAEECPRPGSDSDQAHGPASRDEISPAIYCGDGDDITGRTATEHEAYLHRLQRQSPTIGSIWASIPLACIGWTIRPRWRYSGPFSGNTSAPILWLGNTMDPATPVENAYAMAKRFPGSVVLTQEGAGHCSVSAPSPCSMSALRAYFNRGVLPDGDTVCPPGIKPFFGGYEAAGLPTEVKWDFEGFFEMVSGRRWHA